MIDSTKKPDDRNHFLISGKNKPAPHAAIQFDILSPRQPSQTLPDLRQDQVVCICF